MTRQGFEVPCVQESLAAVHSVDKACPTVLSLLQGRKFSVAGLLADGIKAAVKNEKLAPSFEGGSMFIFRLAPQVTRLQLHMRS